MAGAQKLRVARNGGWQTHECVLAGKGWTGTAGTIKRASKAPDRRGESNELGFALETYCGTAIERWRHLVEHREWCQPVALGSLKGSADERIADQG
jgi:hypothetical protein